MAQILRKRVEVGGGGRTKRARISLYDSPPSGDVSLEEFEQFALDRMRVRECPSTPSPSAPPFPDPARPRRSRRRARAAAFETRARAGMPGRTLC